MGKKYLKIRGIYATALTRLFLDMGYGIVQPSQEIRERFQIPEREATEDISIVERDDKQGIQISGGKTVMEEMIRRLWGVLLDMVVRRESIAAAPTQSGQGGVVWDIEFPGASKAVLDGLRSRVLPTMTNHHRLRVIASDYLDLIEREIELTPHRKNRLQHEFMKRFLYQPLRKQDLIQLEHVRPEGEILRLGEGEIVSLGEGRLLVKRRFHQGRYDGLDLPIEPGDYGVTEVVESAWSLRHRYFRKGGELRGEYGNVNTPIELYPDRIRYVDLHVDVVRRGEEAPRIIDQEELESITRKGLISHRLQRKAMEVSRHLLEELRGSG